MSNRNKVNSQFPSTSWQILNLPSGTFAFWVANSEVTFAALSSTFLASREAFGELVLLWSLDQSREAIKYSGESGKGFNAWANQRERIVPPGKSFCLHTADISCYKEEEEEKRRVGVDERNT